MKIFAHRGASGIAPENTLSAVQLALELPIDGVEIDVYPIEDDYIVLHDRWLTRTTGLAKRVDQISLKELSTLSAGIYLGMNQTVPLLSEILALEWDHKALNLELKQLKDTQHFLDYVEAHLTKNNRLSSKNVIISSFNHHYLDSIYQQTQDYKLGWLTASNYLSYAQQASLQHCHTINVHIDVIDEAMVKNAHSLGMEVFVFTVDEKDDVEMLKLMGVDGIFTNRPDHLARLND